MLDIQFIRSDPGKAAAMLGRRGGTYDFSELLGLDSRRRELVTATEKRRGELNEISKQVGAIRKAGNDATELVHKTKDIGDEISAAEKNIADFDARIREIMLSVPNLPLDDVPDGRDENDGRELRRWGEAPVFDFEPKAHDDLGKALGIMDAALGVSLAKTRFTLLRGPAARLERALMNFMLDKATAKGYEEILPPFMANSKTLMGTGQLPKFAADLFAIKGEDLYLIPTAEVPLTNIPADTVLKELLPGKPMKLTAYTPCFRSEAGSYGKDVRGYMRQHQFNKVELVKICHPDTSAAEHESLTADAEDILRSLGLSYRVFSLCTGDLGFSSARTYDLEVWLPSQGRYREISSCSSFTDFQARRAGIRFKDAGSKKTRFAHTINGSGLAIGRTLIAIFENFQTKDGNVVLPEAIRPYMGGRETLV